MGTFTMIDPDWHGVVRSLLTVAGYWLLVAIPRLIQARATMKGRRRGIEWMREHYRRQAGAASGAGVGLSTELLDDNLRKERFRLASIGVVLQGRGCLCERQ